MDVSSPSIPYRNSFPRPLQPGDLIRVYGISNGSPTCFNINLYDGNHQNGDICLHLSPVFHPPPRVVRNALQGGDWGPEESHGGAFPLFPGQPFDLIILAEADQFKIAVNGQHFTEFIHRVPLSSATHIGIEGDIEVNSLNITMNEGVSKPLGFVTDTNTQANLTSPSSGGGLPYPSSGGFPYPSSFGPGDAPQPSHSYPSMPSSYPSQQGYPNQGYPSQSAYPSAGGYPNPGYPGQGYPSQPGPYPGQYPGQPGPYPGQQPGYPNQYPGQPGPHSGTSVVYPDGGKKDSGGSSFLGPLAAAGAAALAGGTALLSGKKHKKMKKHKYGGGGGMLGPLAAGAAMMGGHKAGMLGPLAAGASSMLGGGGHKGSGGHKHGGGALPGALAGGAAALAGGYMMSKVMKPKKLKIGKMGGYGSSSSSYSSCSD